MGALRRYQVGLVVAFMALGVMLSLGFPTQAGAATNPTITSIMPSQGPALGGTFVTITGTDFLPGVEVFIGAFPASAVVRVSATQVTLTTPAATTTTGGGANVLVRNPDGGVASLNSGFFYTAFENPLAITSVDPPSGPNSGGSNVTIVGTGFSPAVRVYFGDVPAATVNPLGSSAIFARTPANVSGPVAVTVVNPDGTRLSKTAGFTYQAGISVSGVTPGGGAIAGGTMVSISGNGFLRGATVKVGDASASSVLYVNSTQIVAVTPPGSLGSVRVTVTNPSGEAGGRDQGYSYGPASGSVLPVITGVSPASGPSQGGTQLNLTGTGISGGATVYFGGVPGTVVNWNGSSSVFVRTPSNVLGPVAVTIVNNDGGTSTLSNGFTYESGGGMGVYTVSPSTGPAAGGTIVTIGGSGFNPGSWVTFDGVPAASTTVIGLNQIVATTPAGLSGASTVAVTQAGGFTARLAGGFTFTGTPPAGTPPVTTPPVTTPPVTTPPAGGTGAFVAAPVFSPSGQALVIFGGGTVDQLEGASSAAKATGAWVQDVSGTYRLLVVGGPTFLKDQFKASFPAGLTANTVATLTR